MADTKVSALTAATAAALTNELPINEAGTSKKLTVQQVLDAVNVLANAGTVADADKLLLIQSGVAKDVDLSAMTAYFESRARVNNASVANQTTITGNSDVYVVGSDCLIPVGRLQAKSLYRCKFNVTKTGAGAAAPAFNIRIGTAGTTADTSRGTLTFGAQTGVIDEGLFEFLAVFRTVGSGTTAVLQTVGTLRKELNTATGLGPTPFQHVTVTSGGFDSTVSGLKIGLSCNAGVSSAWTVNLVQTELWNLA